MKRILLLLAVTAIGLGLRAQKVDSLFFNLYTDSLKKGTYNYINVDGKLSNGQWLPLTDKHLLFSSNAGKFEGNSLFIDTSCKEEKIIIKVVLKSNSTVWKETTIHIKKSISTERLKTVDELLNTPPRRNKSKKK